MALRVAWFALVTAVFAIFVAGTRAAELQRDANDIALACDATPDDALGFLPAADVRLRSPQRVVASWGRVPFKVAQAPAGLPGQEFLLLPERFPRAHALGDVRGRVQACSGSDTGPPGAGLPCKGMTTGAGADRRLVLLRHAKSAWPDMPDHERPLARRGQRDAPVMGRLLRAADLVPDLVLCSTARRARETWQLARSGLGTAPPVRFDDRVYEASAAALLDLIRRESGAAATLLVVGHDPALPGLAFTLAGAAPDAYQGGGSGVVADEMLDRMRAKFPTAAIAVFGCTGSWDGLGPGSARLVCFITPRDLPGRRR